MRTISADAIDAVERVRNGAHCLSLLADSQGSEIPGEVLGWLAVLMLAEIDTIDAALREQIDQAPEVPS